MASVLVIEDDPAMRRMLSLELREMGFDVSTAWNGVDGLQCLDASEPDIIVLDLEMPVMNGREFYRQLRDRGFTTPVVILSAYEARKAQRELHADAAVQKPFRAETLVAKLRALLGLRAPQDAT